MRPFLNNKTRSKLKLSIVQLIKYHWKQTYFIPQRMWMKKDLDLFTYISISNWSSTLLNFEVCLVIMRSMSTCMHSCNAFDILYISLWRYILVSLIKLSLNNWLKRFKCMLTKSRERKHRLCYPEEQESYRSRSALNVP